MDNNLETIDTDINDTTNTTDQTTPPTTNTPPLTLVHNDIITTHSFSSAFESSRLSTHSSASSSTFSGWAPRARSSSVSSHGSNDSVNLDALIAGGSDINEECPLNLEEADDLVVDWSKQQMDTEQQQYEDDDEQDQSPIPVRPILSKTKETKTKNGYFSRI